MQRQVVVFAVGTQSFHGREAACKTSIPGSNPGGTSKNSQQFSTGPESPLGA